MPLPIVAVAQVKNRYRSGAMVTGYMDVNVTVVFRGLVCEIQMHVRSFFELKAGQHPCYEACRSLGLAGGLRQDAPPPTRIPQPIVSAMQSSLRSRLRIISRAIKYARME